VEIALLIFAVTYLAIAGQRLPYVNVDRPAGALLGAVAMVVFGVLTLEEAYRAVNLDTITLLLGMMVIAAYLVEARFFRATAWWVLHRVRSARGLLWALVFVSGGLSALLVNDTVCLMFAPLVVAVVEEADLPPLPYLLALASASNVGGVITFTGNPQNMLIGMAAHAELGYLEYIGLALAPGLLCLVLDAALLQLMFGRVLPRGPLVRKNVTEPPVLDRVLAAKGTAALALFAVLAATGKSLAGSAITVAAVLILIARRAPRRVLERVDWVLLLFFTGLFVVVQGVARSGALELLTKPLTPLLTQGDIGLAVLAAVTVVGSNLVSNVPFVLVALHWVERVPEPRWGYVVLAFSSTLAGNLTLFGSVANLIVFEGAGDKGRVGFVRFLKYGAVLTLATLTAALAVLWLEKRLGL
jgi:Na+/H+ antiporter NhaD/arsenite permease-like protein